MEKVISVIVPVYNVAAYLPACLDSILSQSYPALEILLIDDGSTDESGRICDEYAARDSRIRVIHQKNGGAAAAKNAGLRSATGTYLAFADSDDLVEPGAYEKLVSALEATGADIVKGAHELLFTDGTELHPSKPCCESGEMHLLRFTKDWMHGLLWDKLYRRNLFDGIFFREGNVIDDEFFTYRGVMNAKMVVTIADTVYTYRQRASSVMRSKETQEKIVFDRLHCCQVRRADVALRFPQFAPAFDEHYLNLLLILSHASAATEASLCEVKAAARDYFREPHSFEPTFGFKLQLLQMRLTPISLLMRCRSTPAARTNINRYFP